MSDGLGDFSMLELFRLEVENQAAVLSEGLLALEQDPAEAARLEALMRAAHSIKGAARMVDVDAGVRLAHAMEDCFVAAQSGELQLDARCVDLLLAGVDQLVAISEQRSDAEQLEQLVARISTIQQLEAIGDERQAPTRDDPPATGAAADSPETTSTPVETAAATPPAATESIRVTADSLTRLMGLAGEVRVESRWLRPFATALLQVKQRQSEIVALLDRLNDTLLGQAGDEYSRSLGADIRARANRCRQLLADRLLELDEFDRRLDSLGNRLHEEVVASRMRPFGDITRAFPRLVRDLARQLGKQVELKIDGLDTRVDRDILEQLEAPLNHLLRNALDHGIETPDERRAAGKREQATLHLVAMHSAGMLAIQIEDDGRGIDPEQLRNRIVSRGLVSDAMAAQLDETELLEFLFLPGFTTREEVTELSGRGVGLDVVHSTVQQLRGSVRASSVPGQGTRFQMQLPVTLSMVRALLVEVGGEPYAIPLARIDRTLQLDRSQVETLEGREYFTLGTQHVGLVFASQVLECPGAPETATELAVVVLGERLNRAGLVVERFLGERNLVVQPLDPRLGKVRDIAAAGLLENGDPCLIVDVDDLLRSIDILVTGGRLDRVGHAVEDSGASAKRILVVDDSITVREVERNMLATRGYRVDVAIDGMDGWNAVRTSDYDLVISDIDMPRMNGFEFVQLIKQDQRLRDTPVMIVSYKDREEDRQRGLEVGADYYLTKGSFHDETLIDAVVDLIGPAC
ncbi:MAG TPA: hybrid sensor histidine kinase/response regulator [Gammaproteobacteria bacterium]|nr:hybrid sensor histidine kinase/response regulator [Gammaproteobacteria bacterium]